MKFGPFLDILFRKINNHQRPNIADNLARSSGHFAQVFLVLRPTRNLFCIPFIHLGKYNLFIFYRFIAHTAYKHIHKIAPRRITKCTKCEASKLRWILRYCDRYAYRVWISDIGIVTITTFLCINGSVKWHDTPEEMCVRVCIVGDDSFIRDLKIIRRLYYALAKLCFTPDN